MRFSSVRLVINWLRVWMSHGNKHAAGERSEAREKNEEEVPDFNAFEEEEKNWACQTAGRTEPKLSCVCSIAIYKL